MGKLVARAKERESEPAKERGWCPRQTGSHEEILHTQRLSISMFEEEREDPRAQGSAKWERKGEDREQDEKRDTAGAVERR